MRSAYIAWLGIAMSAAPLAAQTVDPSMDQRVLRPGDVVRIAVWPQEELSGEFPIDERGTLNLPQIGPVQAGGMTGEELRNALESSYELDMQNPVVTVTPLFTVIILGQVRSPGVYQVTPVTSWLQAIAMAGGFGPEADEEKIRLVRDGVVTEIDAARALESGSSVNTQLLQSGDQIMVPESGMSWRDALTVVQFGATLTLIYLRITRNN